MPPPIKQIRTIQIRRDLASDWVQKNPLLMPGEPGLEMDTMRIKVGDGERAWNDLPYLLKEGINGSVGAQGPRGYTGDAGPQGPQGVQGPQGPAGVTGSKGETGSKGDVGDPGPIGPAGNNGTQGPKGDAGPKGDLGNTGPIGPKGDAGTNGTNGATGPQGPAGSTGPAGSVGPQGPTGATGPQGLKGDTGAQGPQGLKGDTGPSYFVYTNGVKYEAAQLAEVCKSGVTDANGRITFSLTVNNLAIFSQILSIGVTGENNAANAGDAPNFYVESVSSDLKTVTVRATKALTLLGLGLLTAQFVGSNVKAYIYIKGLPA